MVVFSDKEKEQLDAMVQAGLVNIRSFEKNQVLMGMDGDTDEMGILLSGTAYLECVNLDDQRRILSYFTEGDVFSGKGCPNLEQEIYYVISKGKCQVLFFRYTKLRTVRGGHGLRLRLLDQLVLSAQKRLMMHMDILGQRTTRQKLLAYFGYLSREKGSRSFELPFSLTDCADYLAVDRSAMMRELGKLKAEKLLEMNGRRVRLVEQEK